MGLKKEIKTILSIFILLFVTNATFASDYSLVVDSLDINVNITEDNQYQIDEIYENNYLKKSHGFYREVVTDNTDGGFYTVIKDPYCSAEMDIDKGSYSTIFKIGDPDILLTGKKDYNFGYTFDVGKNYSADKNGYDFVYYTLIQSSSYPIAKANFKITFPKEIDPSQIQFASGNVNDTGYSGTYKLLDDNKTIEGSISNLEPNQNVTVYVELPADYFSGQRDFYKILNIKLLISIIIALAAITLAFLLFNRFGHDDDIIEVQSFDVPNGYNPLKLAHFVNRNVSIKDTTAMLFYWADQGFLKIIEDEPDVKGVSEFRIIKLRNLPSETDYAEKSLFKAYFYNVDIDEEITLSDLDEKFLTRRQKAIDNVPKYFNKKNNSELVEVESKKAKNKISGIAAITLFTIYLISMQNLSFFNTIIYTLGTLIFNITIFLILCNVFSSMINLSSTKSTFKKVRNFIIAIAIFIVLLVKDILMLSLISGIPFDALTLILKYALIPTVALYVLAIVNAITEKRSDYATETFGKVIGYKSFIEFVEIDKLKLMIDENPMLFYHTLSFAIVLGLEKKWYKKFETLEIPENNNFGFFMVGSMGAHSMINGINNFNNTVIQHTTKTMNKANGSSSSTGGSGFSASAGGGFGGGGSNGSW